MTEAQFKKLKQHEGIYTRYIQIKEIDGSHETNVAVNTMREVYEEIFSATVDMHCGSCKAEMMNRLYTDLDYLNKK